MPCGPGRKPLIDYKAFAEEALKPSYWGQRKALASKFGITRNYATELARKMGAKVIQRIPLPKLEHKHPRRSAENPHPPSIVAKIVAQKGRRSARELAAKYGFSRNAVIGIWHRHAV